MAPVPATTEIDSVPKGVRLNPQHDVRTRAKIQTSQILNRLFSHVKGEIELTPTQVRAAEVLLKKTLPDLHSINDPTMQEAAMQIFRWADEPPPLTNGETELLIEHDPVDYDA